jgi:dihydroneopterin aldolase
MVVDMQIGAYDDERGRTQKVRINVTVEPSIWPNEAHDNLNETLSYDVIVNHILRVARSGGHVHLVETVAERIAGLCLEESSVRSVTVRVEKLEIYPFAVPGVEITRIKA